MALFGDRTRSFLTPDLINTFIYEALFTQMFKSNKK